VDKHCRMEARPRGSDPVVVNHQDEDPFTCAARAGGKLERALAQRHGQLTARESRAGPAG